MERFFAGRATLRPAGKRTEHETFGGKEVLPQRLQQISLNPYAVYDPYRSDTERDNHKFFLHSTLSKIPLSSDHTLRLLVDAFFQHGISLTQ